MKKKRNLTKKRPIDSYKFPTLIGIIALAGFLLGLNFLGQSLVWGSKASVKAVPQEVRLTNITDNSFAVSWKTDKLALGGVKLFSPREAVISDIRQLVQGKIGEYYTHYVVVESLGANQECGFWVGSNGRYYGQSGKENESAYLVKTAPVAVNVSSETKLAYGQVVDEQGMPVANVLVYLEIPQIAPLSSLTSASGYWVVPLAFAHSFDLLSLADYQEGPVEEEIVVDAGILGRSQVVNLTRNNKPVPPITLGKDDDFRSLNGGGRAFDTESPGVEDQSQFFEGERAVVEKEFALLNPEDDEGVATFRPEIFGTGPRKGKVEIIIESPVIYRGVAEVDDKGSWRWTPPENLSLGEHQLTVKFKDKDVNGQERTLVRNFVVLAAEDSAAFTATPSGEQASPTPTIASTPTLAPTLAPTLTPTLVPTATVSFSPTPTQMPQSGSMIFLSRGFLAGGVVIIAGLLLGFVF